MQFHGHTIFPQILGLLKFGGKGQYIAKMWTRSKIFQVFQNFTKITKYAKNDEMCMFSEVLLYTISVNFLASFKIQGTNFSQNAQKCHF